MKPTRSLLVAGLSAAAVSGVLLAVDVIDTASPRRDGIATVMPAEQPSSPPLQRPAPEGGREALMPAWMDTPLVSGEVRYRDARVRILPPVPAVTPRVAAAVAERAFVGSGIRADVAGAPRTVALARFSDASFGPVGADGTVDPLYENVLAWVVTVRQAPIVFHHQPQGGGTLPSGVCDFVYVVDATSGTPMTAFQACGRMG